MELEVSESKSRRAKIARRLADICDQEEELTKQLRKAKSEREELERMLLAGEGESFSFIEFPGEGTILHALLEVFRSDPNKEWRMKELMERRGVPWNNRAQQRTFRARIYELIRRGLVVKTGRGLYLLKKDPLAGTWPTGTGEDAPS